MPVACSPSSPSIPDSSLLLQMLMGWCAFKLKAAVFRLLNFTVLLLIMNANKSICPQELLLLFMATLIALID